MTTSTTRTRRNRARAGRVFGLLGRGVLYLALVVVFAGPLWSIGTTALSGIGIQPGHLLPWPKAWTLDHFVEAWTRFNVSRYFLNSLIIALIAVVLQTAVSAFAAYALARKRFFGASFILLLFLSTMMMPEEVIAIPLYLVLRDLPIVHLDLINTYAGMILPLVGWAFSIFVLTEAMREVPAEVEESARMDGAGDWVLFSRIVLPMTLPALGTVIVFGFIMAWDQYLLPLIVAIDVDMKTLPVALLSIRQGDLTTVPTFMAAAFLTMIPSVLVYLGLQRFFESGLTSGAIKG